MTIILIISVGICSGRKVSDAKDFDTGSGKANSWIVCGAILGCLVSGQATIGTAQMAFCYGMAAWWFTLGSGIGCLILAVGYVVPLRHSGSATLLEVIGKKYGLKAEYFGSVLCSIGIFISVIAQVLSSSALLTTILHLKPWIAALLAITLMAVYVVFGGTWGAGMGGIVDLTLLSAAAALGLVIVLAGDCEAGGLAGQLYARLAGTELGKMNGLSAMQDVNSRYWNLFSRGILKDAGSGLSLVLGVLSTQTYAQAIWSAKSDRSARKGALLTACFIPPIGISCTLIGIFMRVHCITAAEAEALAAAGRKIPEGMMVIAGSAQAFPEFVLHFTPPLIGGIILGTLLITVVSGGAGLSMGAASILVNDIICRLQSSLSDAKKKLHVTRSAILCILGSAAIIALCVPEGIINDFGFLSMGIRGTVVFVPLTCALFVKCNVESRGILASMAAGPAAVLAGRFLKLPFDSLFLGIYICVMIIGASSIMSKRTELKNSYGD